MKRRIDRYARPLRYWREQPTEKRLHRLEAMVLTEAMLGILALLIKVLNS